MLVGPEHRGNLSLSPCRSISRAGVCVATGRRRRRRRVVDALSLEVFKVRLDGALSNLM